MNPNSANRTVASSTSIRLIKVLILFLSISVLATKSHSEEEFLSAGEIAAISGGAGATFLLGRRALACDTTRASFLKVPLPLESSIQRFFGGRYRGGKRNFLDDDMGGAYTPLAAGVVLSAIDLAWARADTEQETIQDLFLFLSGITATKGVTDIAKGIVRRSRPYMTLAPIDQLEPRGVRSDRTSFFSGHASAAFFSAAYLNLRLRSIMRIELSPAEYHDWRWAPPTVLFGWASFVGLSRIHAYKHYPSDVLIGAAAGYLIAELFYSLGERGSSRTASDDHRRTMFRVSFAI